MSKIIIAVNPNTGLKSLSGIRPDKLLEVEDLPPDMAAKFKKF